MAFSFKYEPINKAVLPILPSSNNGTVTSTCSGYLVVCNSTVAGIGQFGEIPIASTADVYKILGIIANPVDTTKGSTTPFYFQPISYGEVIQATYSTDVEKSTGVSVMASSNMGKYFGIGTGTGYVGFHLDPSICSTAPGTTDCLFFKVMGFSSTPNTCYGTIHSTHLAL